MKIFDKQMEPLLLEQLSQSEMTEQFLKRLIAKNIDFSSAKEHTNQNYIIGRSWRIQKLGKVIGAIWDFPGQFGCLYWQPVQGELESKEVKNYCCINR